MDERADPLLAKLIIPRTGPDRLGRTDLVKRLDRGMAASLILVCAPPGFGKTTLLADWACGQDQPVAWLSLDREDNDPARFWRYVVAALDRVCEGLGQRFGPLLAGPAVLSSDGVVTALINELEALSGEVVLVLDDYHVIESASIHNGLTFLLGHLPGQLHLVISSRSDPPLPVARLRARGQLAELRARDLRFTPEESASFLEKVWGLDLSAEAVAALEAKTEGWAAGLQLAALSLRGRPDPEAFLETFTGSHRYVLDYLSEEVLERQPDRVRAFLLDTSILDRLSGPLCDAVTRAADSQRMLEELERANLFLVPLDEERRWYRYHHLFADLLRARLAQTRPDRALELHTRAAAWCEEHGLIDEAIRHATAAGDADWAMRLVEEHLDETLRHGEDVTLTPAERGFDARHASARHGVPTPRGLVAELPAAIAFLRAELAGVQGDSAGTAACARSALSHLCPDEHGPRFWGRWLLASQGRVRSPIDEGLPMATLLRGLLAAGRQSRAPVHAGAGVHPHRVVQAFGSVSRDAKTISPAVTGLLEPLTDRELDVLRLLAKGKRNQDIAVELVVTLETVKKHVSHILAKLGAVNRTEAVVYAHRLGVIA